jgi:hypothetical protein
MNTCNRVVGAAAVAAALILASSSAQADVTVGAADPNDGGNCIPLSCMAAIPVPTFQEIYDAAAFPDAVQINSFSFYQKFPGQMDSASYHVTFWESPSTVAGLSSNPADNRGAELSDFATFSLSGAMPLVLTLSGNPFTYDPSHGNLLMQIDVTGFTQSGFFSSYFQIDAIHQTRRYIDYLGGTTDNDSLVTTFGTSAVPAGAPEPAAWALMIGGLGLAGAALRRRTASAA